MKKLAAFIFAALIAPLAFAQGQFGNGVTDLSTLAAPYKDGAFAGTLYANQLVLTTAPSPSFTCGSGTVTASAPCLNITQTWNNGAVTFVGADMNITNTASATASVLQRWRVGGNTVAAISASGALSLTGSSPAAVSSSALSILGTYTTTLGAMVQNAATFASNVTGAQLVHNLQPTVTPTGASLTTLTGVRAQPILGTFSGTVSNFWALSAQTVTNASHTGVITAGAALRAENPSTSGTNPITTYSGFVNETITNGNGVTSGTITNYGVQIKAITAAAGAGGTLVNYGAHITTPSGSNAANTNYGLRVTGNGGAASTNWAIYSDSTANNILAGNVRIGSTTAPTNALDVTGNVSFSAYYDMFEMSEPAAPAANAGRFFLKDSGGGKTQACVRFNSGASQCFATEP